jgi:cytidylate kinase
MHAPIGGEPSQRSAALLRQIFGLYRPDHALAHSTCVLPASRMQQWVYPAAIHGTIMLSLGVSVCPGAAGADKVVAAMSRSILFSTNIRPILGAIRSVPVPSRPGPEPAPLPAPPFITISRQPGAGAWTIAKDLVDALNQALPAEQLWTCWDRELVEKVAADAHLSSRLIDSLEDRAHSWFTDLMDSLTFSDDPSHADELKVYHRVAKSIRALAQTGRVVIVGRGGVFITRKMSGGIHVRFVAPIEQRIDFIAREYELSQEQAAARVKELDRNRQAFYRRYWPNETLGPETFALTINTGAVDQTATVQILVDLVRERVRKIT